MAEKTSLAAAILSSKKTLYDSAQAAEALEAVRLFGFYPISSKKISDPALNCFIVDALSGGRRTRLFLKSRSGFPHKQSLARKILSEQGFELIPESFKTPEGGESVIVAGRHWTCEPFISGKPTYNWLDFNCSRKHCFAAGRTLAELHKAGRDFEEIADLGSLSDFLDGFAKLFKRGLKDFMEFAEKFCAEEIVSQDERRLRCSKALLILSAACLEQKLEEIVARLAAHEANSQQVLNHGDFHPGNLIFADDAVVGLVDLDYACSAGSLFDLSYALFCFCLIPSINGEGLGSHLSVQKSADFLDGYLVNGNSAPEMKELQAYLDFVFLLMLDWVMKELQVDNSPSTGSAGFEDLSNFLLRAFNS